MKLVLATIFTLTTFVTYSQLGDLVSLGGKSYFTETARKKYELLDVPMDQVQYYIDDVIWAEREVPEEEIKNSIDWEKLKDTGRIAIREGKTYETLKFPRKTACVLELAEPDKLIMRFGRGEEELLVFYRTSPVNYDKNQYYQLKVDKEGYVTYSKKKFKILEGKTTKVEFKDTFKSKTKKKKTKVKGMKVDN